VSAIGSLLTQQVSVLAAGTKTNRAGAVSQDWDSPVTVGTYPAAVQGLTGTEVVDGARQGSVAKFRVYLPATVAVTNRHRLLWGSRTLEVVGAPRTVYSLVTGEPHHLEVDAREGAG
jgi:head-tail adaptor